MEPIQQGLPIGQTVVGDIHTYQIVLPLLPPSKNQYDGWPHAWKAGNKRNWARRIDQAVKEQGIPHAAKIGMSVKLVFTRNARRDPQNYAQAVWNWVPDALVKSGVIPDDNDGRIDVGPQWGLRMVVGDRKMTVISISMRPETFVIGEAL